MVPCAFVDRWRTKYENDAPEAEEEAVSSVKTLKQKTSLFSLQGKFYLVLFHGFFSIVLRHLCPVHEINVY